MENRHLFPSNTHEKGRKLTLANRRMEEWERVQNVETEKSAQARKAKAGKTEVFEAAAKTVPHKKCKG